MRSLDYPLKSDGSSATVSTLVENVADTPDLLDFDPSDSVKILLTTLPQTLRNVVCLAYGLTEYVSQDLDPEKIALERLRQVSAL